MMEPGAWTVRRAAPEVFRSFIEICVDSDSPVDDDRPSQKSENPGRASGDRSREMQFVVDQFRNKIHGMSVLELTTVSEIIKQRSRDLIEEMYAISEDLTSHRAHAQDQRQRARDVEKAADHGEEKRPPGVESREAG